MKHIYCITYYKKVKYKAEQHRFLDAALLLFARDKKMKKGPIVTISPNSHYRYYKALLVICQALYRYFIITLQIFYNQLFALVDYILNLPDGIAKIFLQILLC